MTVRNSAAFAHGSVLGAAAIVAALVGALSTPAVAKDPYDKLIAQARDEMTKKQGKVSMNLDWPEEDTKDVFPAFQKAFPFVQKIDYFRETGIGPFGRYLISFKQGENPPYDIMHVAGEFQPQFLEAGALVKPPYDYKELNDSLPEGWPRFAEEALDPRGLYLSSAALVRGNVWNERLVPAGKEPLAWSMCTDPMYKGKVVVDLRNKLQAFQYDAKERPRQLAWLGDLVKNDVVLIDGQGPIMQKVASGEYPIACGVNYHTAQRSIDTGMRGVKFSVADTIPLELGTRLYVVKWSQTPATTQLFTLWLATAGQEVLDKAAYRGYPNNPLNRNYNAAKGKYVAVCSADCTGKIGQFDKEYGEILKIPSAR